MLPSSLQSLVDPHLLKISVHTLSFLQKQKEKGPPTSLVGTNTSA